MSDWQEKLNHLKEHNISILIEKNGEIIFKSYDPMLKPLFVCLLDKRDEMEGATVIDKIVGRAAALLMTLGKIKEVYTPLASESAKEVLDDAGIPLHAEKLIPYIINRDNTGMCPMEKMANECKTADEFFAKLESIIKE